MAECKLMSLREGLCGDLWFVGFFSFPLFALSEKRLDYVFACTRDVLHEE